MLGIADGLQIKLKLNLMWAASSKRDLAALIKYAIRVGIEIVGIFFGFTLSSVQGLNGNPNTRQHFVAGGGQCGWLWLVVVVTRVMISVFLTYCGIFFFFVFGLMKCMRFRLSADIFGAKVL